MTAADPCVSVIIIAYNGEAYLAQAIDSVLAQTFQDFELLVVDDGSRDRTRRIAEAYRTAQRPRVRVLSHDDNGNHGMSAARNLGLSQARGEFIAFLDADDVWLPEKLAEQVAILRNRPEVGLVYGCARIWRSWSGVGEDFHLELGVEPDRAYAPPALFRNQLGHEDQAPRSSGAMMRADVVQAVGGFEPAFRSLFESQVFFAKLLLRTSAYVSSAVWFNARQHPASATARAAACGGDSARLRYLAWLADFLPAWPGHEEDRAFVLATASVLRGRLLTSQVARYARRLAGFVATTSGLSGGA
jgi:glycosyltransferase involved in cell wall biosynthesis